MREAWRIVRVEGKGVSNRRCRWGDEVPGGIWPPGRAADAAGDDGRAGAGR